MAMPRLRDSPFRDDGCEVWATSCQTCPRERCVLEAPQPLRVLARIKRDQRIRQAAQHSTVAELEERFGIQRRQVFRALEGSAIRPAHPWDRAGRLGRCEALVQEPAGNDAQCRFRQAVSTLAGRRRLCHQHARRYGAGQLLGFVSTEKAAVRARGAGYFTTAAERRAVVLAYKRGVPVRVIAEAYQVSRQTVNVIRRAEGVPPRLTGGAGVPKGITAASYLASLQSPPAGAGRTVREGDGR